MLKKRAPLFQYQIFNQGLRSWVYMLHPVSQLIPVSSLNIQWAHCISSKLTGQRVQWAHWKQARFLSSELTRYTSELTGHPVSLLDIL